MVKLREDIPKLRDGSLDILYWRDKHLSLRTAEEQQFITDVANLIADPYYLEYGLVVAEILNNLGLDVNSLIAGIIYPALTKGLVSQDVIANATNHTIMKLIYGLQQIDNLHFLHPIRASNEEIAKNNLHNLRKMLLAVVEDVRVVLIKLALHTCEMRNAVNLDNEQRCKLATESTEIYAPVANRLGIGQIKWELEDFSLRYLQPDVYAKIASLLDEKRVDRENYIESLKKQLKAALEKNGLDCIVTGRVKHIYSIWRKMQNKRINYNQVYDVRALRIIAKSVGDCYAALGVVHSLWQNIPKEFDDYIASPKSNGYQSLHTAVFGPHAKIVEVQIRTQDQHDRAELGVAAHWRYKEGSEHEPNYEKKLNELRKILSWQNDIAIDNEAVESLRTELFNDHIYVFTPEGDVIDLPQGSTALDLAYRIHSELGHSCRGAKANGKMIPLTKPLPNGVQVEILTAKNGGPSRDWLNSNLHYVITAKARSKIAQWFKHQNRSQNINAGRELVNKELKRLGFANISIKDIVTKVTDCNSDEELYAGLGCGDIRISQIIGAVAKINSKKNPKIDGFDNNENVTANLPEATVLNNHDFTIHGSGGLVCKLVKCCKPLPGDEIIGYITLGSGISIHRKDCLNILNMRENKKERLVEVSWGKQTAKTYEAMIKIKAFDRRGLLKDISAVVSQLDTDILTMDSKIDKRQIANISIGLLINDLESLGVLLSKIQQVPNVLEVCRVEHCS
jgi:GTP pyrophosphokinase